VVAFVQTLLMLLHRELADVDEAAGSGKVAVSASQV
jgi:hypothetical protein